MAALAPAVFALLTLAMFFDLLFTNQRVVSSEFTDLRMQFIAWREFGFTQLRQGNLPLWNSRIYGGAPYFAGFQSALLYPPNWLHLFLPMATAINWIVAIHLFLAGYFTYLWCRGRAVGIGGSILAGIMFMFSGQYFLHLYAGHLPHLAVMVWTPLMLLAIDKLAESGNWRWCFLGIAATSMQILAGHPQYVYYTGIALTIYTILQIFYSRHRRIPIGGFVLMYVSAILITAVQLFTGIAAAGEMVRSGGTAYEFAAMFALPPENLLTLLTPNFFGSVLPNQYWGAGYLWESSLFVSISGLILAIFGAIRDRRRVPILAMIVMTLLLALGHHTPLYFSMFNIVPLYSSFRGTAKFAYLATLFISLLAGMGFDLLRRDRRELRISIVLSLMLAVAMAVVGVIVWHSANMGASGALAKFIQSVRDAAADNRELLLPLNDRRADYLLILGQRAVIAAFLAAGAAALAAALLWTSRFAKWVPYLLIVLVSVEMFFFARTSRVTMDPTAAGQLPPLWREPLARMDKNQRALITATHFANTGMLLGFDEIGGYDPAVLKRYAELFFALQGFNPAGANQYLPLTRPRLGELRMLRCGLVCDDPNAPPISQPNPLPTAILITKWLQASPIQTLQYVTNEAFDPAARVVLEQQPDFAIPSSEQNAGSVNVIAQTTDSLEIEAALDRPAILLVTDNYSSGWRVRSIASAQADYAVIPADYSLIGIPLMAGKHHFVLEYSPLAFRVGRWVSIISLICFISVVVLLKRKSAVFR
jgi:hypothetical protein